ncbi:MAG: hypothetical protein U0X76_03115 [Bacteroidia bacterium]
MANYRFRVTFEDYDDVVRDIEVRSTQTFDDLHHAIHNAIGFDGSKEASFYMSDDNWKKGKEITSKELSEEEQQVKVTMKKARLCDFIADPHQKIYYIFDFTTPWTFHVELIKINREDEPNASYPRCIRTAGEAPKQYASSTPAAVPVPEDFDMLEDMEDEEEDEPETEDLSVDEGELPEGEEKDTEFTASADGESEEESEFDSSDDDMMGDEELSDSDEF